MTDQELMGSTFFALRGAMKGNYSVLYPAYLFMYMGGRSYPSAEVQSVYSTAPADWAKIIRVRGYVKFLSIQFKYLKCVCVCVCVCILFFFFVLWKFNCTCRNTKFWSCLFFDWDISSFHFFFFFFFLSEISLGMFRQLSHPFAAVCCGE